jgi:hypothetical protein
MGSFADMRSLCLVALMAIAPIGAAYADPLDDAVAAYDRDDYAAALNLWRPLAEQGNARAQAGLGFLYANGHGVPLDAAEAARWYQLAAAQGDALAQGSLGFMYEHGEGVAGDLVRAHAWFGLAAVGSVGALRDLFARDLARVATRMQPQQIAEAQRLARALGADIGSRRASWND